MFSFFLTLVYVILSLILVLGNLFGKMEEQGLSGKASMACWRAKYDEKTSLKNFYQLIYWIYTVLFRFDTSPTKVFLSFDYHFWCICLPCPRSI